MKERYHISGMTCSACSSHVEKSVNKLEAVEKASVNLLTETMEVIYNEQELTARDIVQSVEKAGYGASLLTSNQKKSDSGSGEQDSLRSRDSLRDRAEEETNSMKWRLGISIGFLVVLMYVAMYHMFRDWFGIPIPAFVMNAFHGTENAVTFALTQFLLVLPILYMNRKFFAVGFKTLAHFSPNMDSLIALGASAAMGYGIFALYRIGYGLGHGDLELVEQYSHDLYFESAGMILTLITVGKYLESRSKGRTSEAITKLMDLSPKTAVLVTENGEERIVPTEELVAGDIFLVKPGGMVPVDATVLEGSSSVDEAAITGESVPVEKQAGDKVVSATINKAGFLKCRADRVGEDTTLSQIIKLVEEASASKAPIAKLADQVAGIFVPVVIGIALLTLIGWLLAGAGVEFAVSTAIAVLVISCPCALGLATPVAIMVGTGVGAGHGILIKSGEALQQARDIDTVVLDKTGTITEGKLEVVEIHTIEEKASADRVLALAAALERKSEHPLAEAVVKEATRRGLEEELSVSDFQAVFGRGIEGILAGQDDTPGKYYVGNEAYLTQNGIAVSENAQEALNTMADKGQTPLLVADARRLLGIIGVADTVKESSLEAIAAWRDMGVNVIMLTGDNKRTAEAVRKRLGISQVVAEVLPQDKEKKVSSLKREGHTVAMVGDGINDAPALAAADVGMAIGAGTDVAIESADIILMKSDLRDAVTAMRLSRMVIRNIKENLFWAFFYNSVGIPLAAGLLYPAFGLRLTPMFGAAAMSLSSIFVVGNALRLKGFKATAWGRHKGHKKGEPMAAEKAATAAEKAVANTAEAAGMTTNQNKHSETAQQKGNETMKRMITVEGMMCGHCTGRVQKALEEVAGVTEVIMSLEDKTATVVCREDTAEEALIEAVKAAGYEVTGVSSNN